MHTGRELPITDVDSYLECQGCEFVLLAESASDPAPERWESCPDGGGTDFRLLAGG